MTYKNQTDALNERISLLQKKQAQQLKLLSEQFNITYESLRPINIIKSTFSEVATSPGIKNNILDNVIGLTTGYVSRKILTGATRNPLKKMLGAALQFAVTNIVSKNTDSIKLTGNTLLKHIFKKKNEAEGKSSINITGSF